MSADRYRAAVAVYGVLRQDDHVLLLRRAGSGYHDGELSLPAGHIEGGEDVVTALVRELAEELTIAVVPDDCRLSLVAHRAAESTDDHEYLDLFFDVSRWQGEPCIGEPRKCSELIWADRHDLPIDIIPYVARAVVAMHSGQLLVLDGWAS
ncbi:MAG TPA: NUDIX domain-containing protein [Microlunatus sp.]|nr:NUDIX domain-containing protein [Microlunatus sp.]